ncbi:MAG: hypothetical protein OJF48_004447 [Afipia sp.]|nr:MAG: hypothetical protein OJF48_004447 [Afipia sp.]
MVRQKDRIGPRKMRLRLSICAMKTDKLLGQSDVPQAIE